MKKTEVPVSSEGVPFFGFAAFITLVAAILGHDTAAFAGLLLTGFILYFFRDPDRISPDEEDIIVAPADGKIIKIEKVFDDRFLHEHVYQVSIFMNVFNVHINRSPFPGTVKNVQYFPGTFYSANTERGGLENEACAVTIETAGGRRLAFVQVAGLIARRIVCRATKGDFLARGQKYGLIRFGSRVDLYLPLQIQLEVRLGQKVRGGETVLGYLS